MLVLVAVALCGLAGCSEPDDESANGESQVRTAIKTDFYCGREGYDFDLSLQLSDGGKKLHVEWGLDNIVTGDGEIDPSYRPRPGNANFVRFTGFPGLDDAFGQPPASTKILVEKPLLEGKPGRAKLQFVHADGEFEQSDNACFTD
jgi:hypothetical protein